MANPSAPVAAPTVPVTQAAPEAKPSDAIVEKVPAKAEAKVETKPDAKSEPEPTTTTDPKFVAAAAELKAHQERLLRGYQEMSKREKDMVAEKQKIASDRAELAKVRDQLAEYEKAKQLAKKNPVALLQASGISYDDVAEYVIRSGKSPKELAENAKLSEVEEIARKNAEELENYKKSVADQQKKAEQDAIKAEEAATQGKRANFYNSAIAFVQQNMAQYELTNLHEMQFEVPSLVEKVYAKTHRLLTVKEAAEQVEEYLIERTKKVMNSEKWKKLTAAEQAVVTAKAAAETSKGEAPDTQEQPRTTVDNSLSATTKPSKNVKRISHLSSEKDEQDRMARAVAAFKAARAKSK
jgi:hypothetical protein